MPRSILLSILLVASVALAAGKRPPNVVLILSDDQSWDSIGFMGGKVHTPRLDRMAAEGLFFSDFNVTSTVCSPSRYSFLTGRFAGNCEGEHFVKLHPAGSQTQVENVGDLEVEGWNLARALKRGGYKTGFVGKSHLIRHDWLRASGDAEESPFESYPQNSDPSKEEDVNERMRRNHDKWCAEMKRYGFDFVDGYYGANLKELHSDSLNVHNLDWTVSKAFDFLEESRDEPFFLWFSTTLHHGPSPWVDKFSLDADPRMTGEGFVKEGFNVLPPRKDVLRRNREAGFRDKAAYALWLDDGVGAILDKIKSLGLEENTLVVFVPDHGSFRHCKATLHDYGMRVPMILQWKGRIEPGSTYDDIVANIDFAPTVLDVCGIKPDADYKMDGVSFKRVLDGENEPLRKSLLGELGHSRCVKTKEWKYIAVRYPERVRKRLEKGEAFKGFDGELLERPYLTRNGHLGHHASTKNPHYFEADQLYDLKKDPEELDNVFSDNPEVAERLRADLSTKLRDFENRPFGEFTR